MFKQSLFKELGTNTGKWVSNKVFGDNWSTPYRFSNSGTGMARKALKIEKEIEEKKIDNQLEIEKLVAVDVIASGLTDALEQLESEQVGNAGKATVSR